MQFLVSLILTAISSALSGEQVIPERELMVHSGKKMEVLANTYHLRFAAEIAFHKLTPEETVQDIRQPERQKARVEIVKGGEDYLEIRRQNQDWYAGEDEPVTYEVTMLLTDLGAVDIKDRTAHYYEFPAETSRKTTLRNEILQQMDQILQPQIWTAAYGSGQVYYHEILEYTNSGEISWRWDQSQEIKGGITAIRTVNRGDFPCKEDLKLTMLPEKGFLCIAATFTNAQDCVQLFNRKIEPGWNEDAQLWLPTLIEETRPQFDTRLSIEVAVFNREKVRGRMFKSEEALIDSVEGLQYMYKHTSNGAVDIYTREGTEWIPGSPKLKESRP